jgi:ribosome-binding factor A
MRSFRTDRLGHLFREIISEVIRELKDPRIGFVTVTKVEVSADLHYAKVFVSIMGTEEQVSQSMEGLRSASGFIRKTVGGEVRLRYLPELDFKLDKNIEEGARILALINQLGKEKD